MGAKTVKGPSWVRRPIRPESFRAARKVEKAGLKRSRSYREQAGLQPFGTERLREGGETGLGSSRGWRGFRNPAGLKPRALEARKEVDWDRVTEGRTSSNSWGWRSILVVVRWWCNPGQHPTNRVAPCHSMFMCGKKWLIYLSVHYHISIGWSIDRVEPGGTKIWWPCYSVTHYTDYWHCWIRLNKNRHDIFN